MSAMGSLGMIFEVVVLGLAGSGCDPDATIASHAGAVVDLGACEPREVAPPEGVESAEVPCEIVREDPDAPADLDGDGWRAEIDPDDEDDAIHPGADDVPCDGVDQDGDGRDPCTPDLDGDGYRAAQDCDDSDADVNPLAAETRCNDEDENCDGFDDCDRDADGILDRVDPDPDDPEIGPPEPVASLPEEGPGS